VAAYADAVAEFYVSHALSIQNAHSPHIQLDINSHIPPPPGGWSAARPPPVASAATCAQACAAEPRCNAWTFCADFKWGCGECYPQVAGHAAPGPAAAKFGVHGGCTDGGTSYPFGTCSLKRAANPSFPKPAADADADTWVSGVLAGGGGGVKKGDAAAAAVSPDEEGLVESRQAVDSAAFRARKVAAGGKGGGHGGAAAAAAGKHDGGP
jgi:hypothetical protein